MPVSTWFCHDCRDLIHGDLPRNADQEPVCPRCARATVERLESAEQLHELRALYASPAEPESPLVAPGSPIRRYALPPAGTVPPPMRLRQTAPRRFATAFDPMARPQNANHHNNTALVGVPQPAQQQPQPHRHMRPQGMVVFTPQVGPDGRVHVVPVVLAAMPFTAPPVDGDFDALLHRLFTEQQATPQAKSTPARVIRSLQEVCVTEEHATALGMACPVCQDDLVEGDACLELPCRHLYHKDCVLPWLKEHSTCPTCRQELCPAAAAEEDAKDVPTVSEYLSCPGAAAQPQH